MIFVITKPMTRVYRRSPGRHASLSWLSGLWGQDGVPLRASIDIDIAGVLLFITAAAADVVEIEVFALVAG